MKRGWQWPVLITASLLFTVGVNVVMLFAAGADPNGTVVEPEYYRKAVEWDRTMAQRATSDALGWQAEVAMGSSSPDGRRVTVKLRDASGAPVTGADVRVTLIHNLEAAHPLQSALTARAGEYSAELAATRAGRWEVRVEARRGQARFYHTTHVEAP
ncbi:MAG: FixH family protein [Gemmatimonadaceae bacterium]|nr:FixH family protein [Gemmatimonadaceae bacterium]